MKSARNKKRDRQASEQKTDLQNLPEVLQEIKIKVGDKSYTISEASYTVARAYRKFVTQNLIQEGEGTTVNPEIVEAEILLVSSCLTDINGEPVDKSVVENWPARTVKAIFNEAKRISDLGEESEKTKGEQ